MYVQLGLFALRHWKQLLIAVVSVFLIIFVTLFSILPGEDGENPDFQGAAPKVSEEVSRWEPVVAQYVQQYGLEEKWVPVLLAIMQQESGGVLADVMQSSESAGLPPGTITDPVASIEQGVRHWKNVLAVAAAQGIRDEKGVIQAYNYGSGWLLWLKGHGGAWSDSLAISFSQEHTPAPGVCSSEIRTRYHACYGDFQYAEKVSKNLVTLSVGSDITNDATFNGLMQAIQPFEGQPYVWGGDTAPTFDCSGLIMWGYNQLGIRLPRTAEEQYNATKRISESELRPGDLVFFTGTSDHAFISHVGVYVGNGKMFNSNSKGVEYSDVTHGYWKSKLYAYGRIK